MVVHGPIGAADIFYGPMRWSEKVQQLHELVAADSTEPARRYLERAQSIAKFTLPPGDVQMLQRDEEWATLGEQSDQPPYGLIVREQRDAVQKLEDLGAMNEIARALIDHTRIGSLRNAFS
jgi:hypothetical protein